MNMPGAPKKLLILAILEILKKYTDSEHRLLQCEIMAKLESDYDLTATRKSVRANIADLETAGYPVYYDGGWYYEHEFCEAELNLLIDSILYNPVVSRRQCLELTQKLKTLGGDHYRAGASLGGNRPNNPQFMFTLDILHEAMDGEKKVLFQYADYDVDKQLHPRLNEQGKPKEYSVSPYRVVFTGGRYYLICNVDGHDTLTHFRLDYVLEARVQDAPARPMWEMEDFKNGIDTAAYLTEHPNMFTGKVITAKIIADRSMVSEILDRFGMGVNFTKVTETEVEAELRTDELSLKYWIQMYREFVRRVEG